MIVTGFGGGGGTNPVPPDPKPPGPTDPVVTQIAALAAAPSLATEAEATAIAAMFQSLGLKNRSWGPLLDRLATAFAVIIFIGYSSIPAAILLGLGKEALN